MTDTSTGETPTKKSKPAKRGGPQVADGKVGLEELLKEFKLDGPTARRYLRAAGVKHTAGKAWCWDKGSAALKEARAVLTK